MHNAAFGVGAVSIASTAGVYEVPYDEPEQLDRTPEYAEDRSTQGAVYCTVVRVDTMVVMLDFAC